MTWYKLSPWRVRLGASALSACLLTLAACDASEVFEPQADAPPEAADAAEPGDELVAFDDTLLAAASRRGIPIGNFAQPMSAFGRTYNGGHQNFSPGSIVRELKAIRARGGRGGGHVLRQPQVLPRERALQLRQVEVPGGPVQGINLSRSSRTAPSSGTS